MFFLNQWSTPSPSVFVVTFHAQPEQIGTPSEHIANQKFSFNNSDYSCFCINLMFTFMFRPFPFRVENADTGEALSLWHLTSPAPSVPLTVGQTLCYGPEVTLPRPRWTDNRQRSFVMRRHAHTGPLSPIPLIPSAFAATVCLLVTLLN